MKKLSPRLEDNIERKHKSTRSMNFYNKNKSNARNDDN